MTVISMKNSGRRYAEVSRNREFIPRICLESLFAPVMDNLTNSIENSVPWCMSFLDDIMLIDKTKQRINQKLEL